MIMKRKGYGYVLTIIVMTLLIVTVLPAYAATEGTSTGTLSVGNTAPTLSGESYTDVQSSSVNGQQIDVNEEYWLTATIGDDNQLTDLTNVTYIIWGPSSSEGGADSNSAHYTFTYTQGTDAWEEQGPDAAGDSHLVSANCSDPADQAQTSGSFRLAFKLHKTGEHTDTATWNHKVIVYDDSDASDDTNTTFTHGVNFYAELTVDDSTHSWTGYSAGTNDNVINGGGGSDGDIDVTVTANAAFDLQSKGSGNLADNGNTVGLGNVTVHADTLGSSVSLTTSYADIGGLTAQSAGESQPKAFKLWIDIPSGQTTGDYTYTLYVQVVEA